MPKNEDFQKHTLHLFRGDYAKLQELHPDVPVAHVIRSLIQAYIKKMDPPVDTSRIKSPVSL